MSRSVRARTSSKKRNKRVAPKRAYAGPLIASKVVRIAKPGARIRQRHFGNIPSANRNWIGSKSVGSEYFFSSLIAEALIAHLFKKLGNQAVDKDNTSGSSFLARINVGFTREDQTDGGAQKVNIQMITTNNSFNGLVYNTSPFNIVTQDGSVVSMRGWNEIIYTMATRGFYPAYMFAWGKDTGSTPNEHEIYREEALGRANIKMNIRGTHKFQNITPGSGANFDANAIDANPLEGKIYTYRNQMPKWQPTWLASQEALIGPLEDYVARPVPWGSTDYAKLNIDSTQVMPSINVFEAPPLRPTTVFANCNKSGKVYFPPGGFKVFKTQFSYDGSFRRLVMGLTQAMRNGPGSSAANGRVPPLGSCFLMCVIPTLKSLIDESVSVAYDYEKDGEAHMTAFRGGTLPTTNLMQGTTA